MKVLLTRRVSREPGELGPRGPGLLGQICPQSPQASPDPSTQLPLPTQPRHLGQAQGSHFPTQEEP